MQGANKEFLKDPEHFLRHNMVKSPITQTYLGQKWRAEEKLSDAEVRDRFRSPEIYEFDLVPNHKDVFKSPTGKVYRTYQLALLETRAMQGGGIKQSRVGALVASRNLKDVKNAFTGKDLTMDLKRQHLVGERTNRIRAYYIPWDNDKAWTVQLGDEADFCFTPTLDGCTIAVEDGPNPKITHANFQHIVTNRVETLIDGEKTFVDRDQTVVDQNRIDQKLAKRHGASTAIRTLKKDDYSNHTDKLNGIQTFVTVVGIRDHLSRDWHFYHQLRRSELVDLVGGGSGFKNIFSGTMTRI